MTSYRILLEQPAIPEYLAPLIHELHLRLGDRLRVAFGSEHQGTRSAPAMINATGDDEAHWLRRMAIHELPLHGSWFRSGFRGQVERGDVVVLAGNPRILSNIAWLATPGIGTVWWGQGWGANTTPTSAKIRLALANRFSALLFYDQTEAPLIGAWLKKPTFYINNTIAYSTFDQFVPRTAPRPAFCFVGRLTEKAGATRLPLIAKLLLARIGNRFQIGIIGDGPERVRLEATIAAHNLQRLFKFHGAMFDRDVVSQVLHQYAFLLYPGAIGLTTQHALSEGLPVITHRNLSRHMPEARLLQDGRNALLCDDDVDSYAATCERALALDNASYRQLQTECLRIRDTHSIHKMADAFLAACDAAHSAALAG